MTTTQGDPMYRWLCYYRPITGRGSRSINMVKLFAESSTAAAIEFEKRFPEYVLSSIVADDGSQRGAK